MRSTMQRVTFAATVLALLNGTVAPAGGVARGPAPTEAFHHMPDVTAAPRHQVAAGEGDISTAPPDLSFNSSAFMVPEGESVMLFWTSINTTSCTASGAWSGTKATRGAMTLMPNRTGTYILTCTGPGGSISQSVTIEVTRD